MYIIYLDDSECCGYPHRLFLICETIEETRRVVKDEINAILENDCMDIEISVRKADFYKPTDDGRIFGHFESADEIGSCDFCFYEGDYLYYAIPCAACQEFFTKKEPQFLRFFYPAYCIPCRWRIGVLKGRFANRTLKPLTS